jgi:hypothetical protein
MSRAPQPGWASRMVRIWATTSGGVVCGGGWRGRRLW